MPPKPFTIAGAGVQKPVFQMERHVDMDESPTSPTEEMIREENLRLGRLRKVVDMTLCLIRQESVGYDEAIELMEFARRESLKLVPDKETVFDLLIMPRFRRALSEKFPIGF